MGRPFLIQRSAEFAASPAALFSVMNNLSCWNDWSPWAKADPGASTSQSGPTAGVGAALEWEGKKSGAGRMEIVESVPGQLVRLRLDFRVPFRATHETRWELSPREGGGTRCQWIMTGDRPWLMVPVAALMGLDRMMEGQFDEGLRLLGQLVERA